jgi:propanediol dehydratase small subunit
MTKGSRMSQETKSVNDIRAAIRALSARAELARKEGRPEDAAELEQRVAGYRQELAAKP